MKCMMCAFIVLSMALSPAFSQAQTATIADLTARAKQGDAAAQVELGVKYFTADGVAENIPEAIRLFALAADKKSLDAQLNLGWIYGHTEGYLDAAKSATYYGMAAAQGNPDAQYFLGLMYLNGEGIKKEPVKAAEWLKKSALQNKTEAQTALGDLYETGQGVKADKVEALKWYLIALKNGDGAADLYIESIKPGMKASQIKDAEARAAAF